jgi:hypothetical protein
MRDKIMNVNPRCLAYATEDCRSVLNIATTDDKQIDGAGTETGWITVESKKVKRQAKQAMEKQTKRIKSCLTYLKSRTYDKSRNYDGNGEAKTKRVRFMKE